MTAFLLGAGFLYIRKGINKRDALRVWLGATIFIYTIIIKIMDVLGEYIDGKFMVGLFAFIFGALFLGVVVYIRSKWTVSNAITQNNTVIESKNDVLDDTNIGAPSEG